MTSMRGIVLREAKMIWRLSKSDLLACLPPQVGFSVSAHMYAGKSIAELPITILRAIVISTLFQLSFMFPNQIVGVEEDRLNKPNRPIPSGLLSVRGAYIRWVAIIVLYCATTYLLGGIALMQWALAWVCHGIIYNFSNLSQFWLTKNEVSMTTGVYIQMSEAWQHVTPINSEANRFIMITSIMMGIMFHTQDLRDCCGDAKRGRLTLPLCIGIWPTRVYLCSCFAVTPIVVNKLLVLQSSALGWVAQIVLALLNWILIVRLLLLRLPSQDNVTYQLFCVWFVLVNCTAFLFMY